MKNINNFIEIGFNGDDIFIISEIMYLNNIKKFHQFFNNLANDKTTKPTKVLLPYTNELVDIYHAHIGSLELSRPAEMFFRFLFGLYNFKDFDMRHMDALFYNRSLDDIVVFTRMVSKCKDAKLCNRVFKKINLENFFRTCFFNLNVLINSHNKQNYY